MFSGRRLIWDDEDCAAGVTRFSARESAGRFKASKNNHLAYFRTGITGLYDFTEAYGEIQAFEANAKEGRLPINSRLWMLLSGQKCCWPLARKLQLLFGC